jgi:Zn-dependent oligopeptidase
MTYEGTILIKLDKDTKRRMKEINTNWSELIREFIQKELNRKRNIARAEKLRAKLFRQGRGMDSAQIIRYFRDTRYGPDRP